MQNSLTKSDIKIKIENLEKYFEKYENHNVSKKLEEIKQKLNNQEYRIAVVANMSAGKSTFINALFGKEVLPAFDHATTDSATYIYSKPNVDKKAEIFFSDGRKKLSITAENLEEEIKQYAQKDEDCKDDKYKNVEKINLYYPFKNLQTSSEDMNIVFIDTPGPNSNGKSYAQKHKDQTSDVIREKTDMVLFTFDYGQLDSNLDSDKQGLWGRIKNRLDGNCSEKSRADKNFEVYFLINKIDRAMDENIKFTDDEDEAKKRLKEKIFEKQAINKIRKAANEHGIKNPKIYAISSLNSLLHRNPLPPFKKQAKEFKSFREYFDWIYGEELGEEKFIEYLGISELENDINNYINTRVKEKMLITRDSEVNNINFSEIERLRDKISFLEQPKNEAENNLNEATKFLEIEADKIEAEFMDKSYEFQKKYIESIKKVINDNIENKLNKNIPEATNRTIKFLELFLEGYNRIDSENDAKNLPIEQIKYNLNGECISITISQEFTKEEIEKNLQNFIISILNDYKNNYLDMKIEIKNNYLDMSEDIGSLFNKYKLEFNKKLKKSLNIENIILDENKLYTKSIFSEELSIPTSTIEYKYQDEVWKDGGSFSSREKVRDEEHKVLINPENIKKIFSLSINSIKRTYLDKEIKTYEDTIINFIKLYQDKFNEFKQAKKQEIKQIEKEFENSKQSLELALEQHKEFEKYIKGI